MNVNISREELLLLAYLHEHVAGFDRTNEIAISELEKVLGRSKDELRRDTTFLDGFGLIGLNQIRYSDNDGKGSSRRC